MDNIIKLDEYQQGPDIEQVLFMQAKTYALMASLTRSNHYLNESKRLLNWYKDLTHQFKDATVILFNPMLKGKKVTLETK
jgi:hypothetical protein